MNEFYKVLVTSCVIYGLIFIGSIMISALGCSIMYNPDVYGNCIPKSTIIISLLLCSCYCVFCMSWIYTIFKRRSINHDYIV